LIYVNCNSMNCFLLNQYQFTTLYLTLCYCFLISHHYCSSSHLTYNESYNKEELFQNYLAEYKKPYLIGTAEYQYRFLNFLVIIMHTGYIPVRYLFKVM